MQATSQDAESRDVRGNEGARKGCCKGRVWPHSARSSLKGVGEIPAGHDDPTHQRQGLDRCTSRPHSLRVRGTPSQEWLFTSIRPTSLLEEAHQIQGIPVLFRQGLRCLRGQPRGATETSRFAEWNGSAASRVRRCLPTSGRRFDQCLRPAILPMLVRVLARSLAYQSCLV